jgi:hypothetical protein
MPKESYKEKAPPTLISTPVFAPPPLAEARAAEIRAVRGRPTRK